MEWRINFNILMVNLLALSFVYSDNDVVYYVRPYFPQNVDCPSGYQCDSLNNYSTETDNLGLPENNTVTMIFIQGNHTIDSGIMVITYNFGCPVNPYTLHIIGNGNDTTSVIVQNIKTATTVKNMTFESFTGSKISLYTHKSVVNSQITNITILNCIFIESTMILTNVNLTIKDSNFSDSISTAIILFSSTLTIMGQVSFLNNRGYQGGALMLVATVMNIAREANLLFQENHAENTGGAIFVVHPQMLINLHGLYSSCFYQLLDYDENSTYNIRFINNSAAKGGDHIYGASLKSGCSPDNSIYSFQILYQFFWFDPGLDSLSSAVSADATRACICDENGQPVCETIDVDNILTYPGGQFSLPVVVVGGDYGTTTGSVYVSFLNETSTSLLESNQQYEVISKSSECTMLNFSVHSNESSDIMFLTVQETHIKLVEEFFEYYECMSLLISLFDGNDTFYIYDCDMIETDIQLRNTPLFVYIDFLPCPPGFILSGNPTVCQCHPVLIANDVDCILSKSNGYHKWNSTNIWIQAVDNNKNNSILFSTHCPFSYCNPSGKDIDLSNPDNQCVLNRAGILCGGCKRNYSLAIGSSRCIHCLNNNNLALLIFFVGVGIFLVLVIAALNLTVTQGMINSLVFYANIIWAFQNILYPSGFGRVFMVHKTFIAWLSLDFGIETCFFRGMNAYTKMWLQFIFPFYTATLFFLGLRFSSKLSKLFGSRSVPTLGTLLFLSYSKLLRTIISCFKLVIYYCNTYDDSKVSKFISIAWAIDGNYSYGRYPHIFLLLAAIACFLLLWIPYTLLLFSMQWLRSVDHLGPLKFIGRYKPLYDAYFAPLRDKHHYWFGLLLLSQGLLLLLSSLTLYTLPEISVLLLLAVSIFLLCYVISVRPYKQMSVVLLEGSFMVNFIVLAVGYLYFRDNKKGMMILLSLSMTAALVEFCGIVVWNLIPKRLIKQFHAKNIRNSEVDSDDVHILEEHHSESEYVSYQESQSIKLANVIAEK